MILLPAHIQTNLQAAVGRGIAFLLPMVAAFLLGLAGTGLLAAATVLHLAQWAGMVPALALVAALVLLVALGLWRIASRKGDRPVESEPDPEEAAITQAEAAFTVGFVIGRALLRQLARNRPRL